MLLLYAPSTSVLSGLTRSFSVDAKTQRRRQQAIAAAAAAAAAAEAAAAAAERKGLSLNSHYDSTSSQSRFESTRSSDRKQKRTSYDSQIPACTCPHTHCFSNGTLLSPTACAFLSAAPQPLPSTVPVCLNTRRPRRKSPGCGGSSPCSTPSSSTTESSDACCPWIEAQNNPFATFEIHLSRVAGAPTTPT